jgi:hypothetical protein
VAVSSRLPRAAYGLPTDAALAANANIAARARQYKKAKVEPDATMDQLRVLAFLNVSQPRPGWHQWTTPSGRTYTQGPMRYPV